MTSETNKKADDAPPDAATDTRSACSKGRWFTPEFLVYWIVIFGGYGLLIKWGLEACEPYNKKEKRMLRLREGWVPGRLIDMSDSQWSTFRDKFLSILLPGMLAYLFVSWAIRQGAKKEAVLKGEAAYLRTRMLFYAVAGVLVMCYVHGTTVLFMLAIITFNYVLVKTLSPHHFAPLIVWAFNIFMLFTVDWNSGFAWKSIGNMLGMGDGLKFLDDNRGIMRWHVSYNLCMLRLISFSMDYYWAATGKPLSPSYKKRSKYSQQCEESHPLSDYSLLHCIAYVFYFPLYIAGPIITFNAFVAQIKEPQTTYSLRTRVFMLLRVLGYMIAFEFVLHYLYYYNINEYGKWRSLEPWELGLTGYFTLNFMYTKFLIIWRFFRTWALLDGVDSPENMNRCVNNNFTFTGFWRAWHGSLNQWIVRYMYIPLGGSKWQVLTVWPIFSFIGLWHDLILRWQAWAMLNCAFFSLEIMLLTEAAKPKYDWFRRKVWYRHVVAAAGASNVFLLMAANLAILHGFSGTYDFMHKLFLVPGGGKVFVAAWTWLFCGVITMLEIREAEDRSAQTKRF